MSASFFVLQWDGFLSVSLMKDRPLLLFSEVIS